MVGINTNNQKEDTTMAGIGDGFTQGLALGQNWRRNRDEKKMMEARLQLDAEAMQQRRDDAEADRKFQMGRDAKEYESRKELLSMKVGADAQALREGRYAASEARLGALLGSSSQPGPSSFMADALKTKEESDRWRERNPPAGEPLATVTEKAGDTTVSSRVPLSEAKKQLAARAASAYQSPYRDELTEIEGGLAEQKAEIDGGDDDMGFLGLGGSRHTEVNKLKKRRFALKAMELEDMVRRGLIDQDEADRRSNAILSQP
jgi:hypothetical protein